MDNQSLGQTLLDIYRRMMVYYGPQHWWPADEPFEVMVGAVLTQSANWRNVEKAIDSLKTARALSPEMLRNLSRSEIAVLIHASGYYNVKALKLKSLAVWLGESCGDDMEKLFATETENLRRQLLSVHGIGPETADSIILYAARKPVFVIDAYTYRIISRIGLAPDMDSYTAYQALFMNNLPVNVGLFNEYHALLVSLAKDVCRSHPVCRQCCLASICCFYLSG